MISTVFSSLIFSLFLIQDNLSNENAIKIENVKSVHTSKELKNERRGRYYYVSAYRAYFYSGPNYISITKKFLVEGDECQVRKFKNGFGYVVYYNSRVNKTTSGWLDLNDLEEIYGCSNK